MFKYTYKKKSVNIHSMKIIWSNWYESPFIPESFLEVAHSDLKLFKDKLESVTLDFIGGTLDAFLIRLRAIERTEKKQLIELLAKPKEKTIQDVHSHFYKIEDSYKKATYLSANKELLKEKAEEGGFIFQQMYNDIFSAVTLLNRLVK